MIGVAVGDEQRHDLTTEVRRHRQNRVDECWHRWPWIDDDDLALAEEIGIGTLASHQRRIWRENPTDGRAYHAASAPSIDGRPARASAKRRGWTVRIAFVRASASRSARFRTSDRRGR